MTTTGSEERFTVLIADQISAEGLAPLRADGRFTLVDRPGLKGAELAAAIADADAVLVRSATKITRESLQGGTRLRVIGRAGVGVDTIDVDAATERGVAVLTAPSGNTISAAELTFALLLSIVRRLPAADASMKAGVWDRKSFTGTELYGKTLGLVGAGRIGGEVARRARAFGMRVVVYDPFLTEEHARRMEAELLPLEAVLERADVVSLHVPLTEATTNLLDDAALARMKPGAVLINAARGGVVNEGALARALAAGTIAGAALDVYEAEPLPADHPLRTAPNVVLTPHLGASTAEAQQNVAIEIAEAVRAALIDGDLSRAVNAPAVGGEAMRRLRPLLDLSERLGRLASALAADAVAEIEVKYAGAHDDALRPITASVLIGLLAEVSGRTAVNIVNATHLAASRGIAVTQTRSGQEGAYAEHIEVRVAGSGGAGEALVAGALIAAGHPRVVRIGAHHVDVIPRGTLVVIRNRDVPGVIGRVGTLLGNASINIGEYHQSRLSAGGDALAALSVDGRLPSEVIEALRRLPEVLEVRQAGLG